MMHTDDLCKMTSEDDWFWDDAKGGWSDGKLVMEARAKELEYARKMRLYDKVPRTELWRSGAKAPIRVRWVDTINARPGDPPDVRSRLVAKQFAVGERGDIFAATPSLEAIKT